jgi:hypothetical protein
MNIVQRFNIVTDKVVLFKNTFGQSRPKFGPSHAKSDKKSVI